MALIENAKPKSTSGAYFRLFGNEALGKLMSKAHSTVISSGNELEEIIKQKTGLIDNLDSFINNGPEENGKKVFVADKKSIKKSILKAQNEPDFLIFKGENCYIVELKDGDTFDTKKSLAEKTAMKNFKEKNGSKIKWTMSIHFCCFNQKDKQQIIKGFKQKITKEEALTGKEFCELLEIDYDEIVNLRKKHQEQNFKYFRSEILNIIKP